MEYSSNGKGNLGVTLGAIGTGLGILGNGMGLLNNVNGNNNCCYENGCFCADDKPITRYEARMMQELSAKDGKIALLEADKYTDKKISDTYIALEKQIRTVDGRVTSNREEQQAVNQNQAMYNGANNATISCIQSQVESLVNLTKRVIPNESLCPGYGEVGIQICPPCGGNKAK